MKRRIAIIALLVLSVLVLSGCTLEAQPMDKLAEGNFFFSTFVYPLAMFLRWLHVHLGNYGWAILILTVIVRLIVLPLAIKQYKSMKGMQKIQPQMKELREKYKDDAKQMQAETMKLMQEHNVNPAAGCLPLIIQMPILFALYYAINTVEVVGGKIGNATIDGETFLWFHLGKADPTYILPILAAVTTIIPMMISMKANSNQQMKWLIYIFPIMIFFFSYQLPSALPLYWVYSNIFTAIQSYFLYREKPGDLALATNGVAHTSSVQTKTDKKKKKRRK